MNEKSDLKFYKQHVENVLLPFWSRALDHTYGGVYTCFNNAGDALVSKDKYTWSQGRFVWLWSKIAKMRSEDKLEGTTEHYYEHLHKTVSFLEENVFLENGNCAFLLSEAGNKKESIPGRGYDTSFYADCFVVLGLAAYASLLKDSGRFETALQLYYSIRERLKTAEIRSEPYPIPDGYRAHSVPMIMLNVTQELTKAAETLDHQKSKKLYQHSIEYMQDIMDHFYQDDHIVVEMLPTDPTKKNALLSRHLNPGHTIESMWFVLNTAQKAGNTDYIQQAIKAIEQAVNRGWDPDFGGLFRFIDKEGGRPKGKTNSTPYEQKVANSWDLKLWWPHTEALYATLRAFIVSGDKKIWTLYEQIQTYVFDTFPNPDKEIGEWIQIRDRKGKPVDKVAALPVKDPFHILRNMLLIIDLLGDRKAKD